jgi:hypothetical protein
MNPPSVELLISPSNHRTINTAAIVHDIGTSFPIFPEQCTLLIIALQWGITLPKESKANFGLYLLGAKMNALGKSV